MKYSKRYIAFTGVLAVALLIKFNNFGEQYQTVNRFSLRRKPGIL